MNKQTILIVDDTLMVLETTEHMLHKEGFLVLTATNGMDALQILRANKENVSLVLLDLTMPIIDGFEVYTKIQNLYPGLPVIFCSGCGFVLEKQPVRDLINNRVVRYLQKPFSFEELINIIQSVLRGQ